MPNIQEDTKYQGSYGWMYAGVIAGVIMIYLLAIRVGILPAIIFAGIPLALICVLQLFQKLSFSFYVLFVMNYLVMGINRYYSMKSGMLMTFLVLGLLFFVLMQNMYRRMEWERSKNLLVAFWGIWFIYCIGEVFNTNSMLEPWFLSIPQVALFPLVFAILVPVLITRYKQVQWLLVIWAILTLIASAKGYWQRNRGFDSTELNWLYYGGGHTPI